MTTPKKPVLSECCKAKMLLANEEGTKYYVCDKCCNPLNPDGTNPKQSKGNWNKRSAKEWADRPLKGKPLISEEAIIHNATSEDQKRVMKNYEALDWKEKIKSLKEKLIKKTSLDKDFAERNNEHFVNGTLWGIGIALTDDVLNEIIQSEIQKAEKRGEEVCICAAVLEEDGTVIRGHRHGDCFQTIRTRGKKAMASAEAQGFVTSKNRFVIRSVGRKLQDEAGIKSADPEGYRGSTLFSEDLY